MASVESAHSHVTYADLERWPDDGKRYELYDGEVRMVPSPAFLHQVVQANVIAILRAHQDANGGVQIGTPTDIVFRDDTVLQPDATFIAAKKLRQLDPQGPIRCVPDLVVEILSPSTSNWDRTRKFRIYARSGVAEYWIIDPGNETVEILELKDGDYRVADSGWRTGKLRSARLPGLVIAIEEVFFSPLTPQRPSRVKPRAARTKPKPLSKAARSPTRIRRGPGAG
jgi:Uma2 family endonuclease